VEHICHTRSGSTSAFNIHSLHDALDPLPVCTVLSSRGACQTFRHAVKVTLQEFVIGLALQAPRSCRGVGTCITSGNEASFFPEAAAASTITCLCAGSCTCSTQPHVRA
jgi:hypothetical protein